MKPDLPCFLTVLLSFVAGQAARADWRVWTVTETRHMWRSEPPGSEAAANVAAAHNEWASLQILLSSGQPVPGVRVEAGNLRGPHGALLHASESRLYRQHQLPLEVGAHRNDAFRPDWYPDPLIPAGPVRSGSGVTRLRGSSHPTSDAAETSGATEGRHTIGPLRVHPANSRYFTDGTRNPDGSLKAVYLTGSHTWLNLQDGDTAAGLPPFDYDAYLDFLQTYHHNFIRLWAWEGSAWVRANSERVTLCPLPFARTGPGQALDGQPKFDVTKLNPAYFDRLRERVAAARRRGFYVGIMLFQGFSVARKDKKRTDTPWTGHPLHAANNVNGLDGDANGDGEGYEVHTLGNPAITRVQEAYVRRVIDTVNDLDNVIYEISNESHGGSTAWQYHMIDFIHRYEQTKPAQHPVWMSFCWDGVAGAGTMADLLASSAEAVSPPGNDKGHQFPKRYLEDPPADASKVVIADTDHLWGVGGHRAWVWKSFLRGLHPIFMDTYRHSPFRPSAELDPSWEEVRRALGVTRRLAERVNLAAMTPHNDLASTAYCLADPGREYLVYLPKGGEVRVDLTAASGSLAVEWLHPVAGTLVAGTPVEGGAKRTFQSPHSGEAVLYLKTRAAGKERRREE